MRKLAGVLAACVMFGSLGTMSVAAEDKVVVGQRLQFSEGNGPVIINERLMLPLRAVSETRVYFVMRPLRNKHNVFRI